MRFLRPLHLGDPLADQRVCDDEPRTATLRSPGARQNLVDGRDVVSSLDVQDLEPVGFETLGRVLALRLLRHRVQRHVVRVVDQDQIVQLEMRGHRRRLGRHALLDTTVARQRPDRVVEDRVRGGVETRPEHLRRHRLSDSVSHPLPERAGGGLDAGRVAILRVSRRLRAPLPETLEFVDRQGVTAEVEPRVQKHAPVPGRQNESIAVDPIGIERIVAKQITIEHGAKLRCPERQTQVTRGAGLDSVHG